MVPDSTQYLSVTSHNVPLSAARYQVWLEAYLKNGKKRVSEVREFVTKPGEIGKAEEIKGEGKGQCLFRC